MLTSPRCRLAAVVFLLLTFSACSGEPSDDQLLDWFARNRSDLERLVRMSDEDFAACGVIRVAPTFTRLVDNWGWPRAESEWGISRDRWDEYRRVFRRAGLNDGLNRDGERHGQIHFSRWGVGLADNSRERGILFAHAEPHSIRGESQTFDVRHIDGQWYLYTWVTW